MSTTAAIKSAIQEYLAEVRWFGGKGRDFAVTGVRRLGTVGDPSADPRLVVDLVEVTYADGSTGPELYQLPLVLAAEPQRHLDHAFVGWWEEPGGGWTHAYDAVHDRAAMGRYLAAFLRPDSERYLRFIRLEGHTLDTEAQPTLFSGEQSNSSVMFGEDSLLKLFRKVTPGENPDITTHRVLTEAGSPHVAELYGWIEAGEGDETLHLGMLQQFLRTASDGWEIAVASVRDLFAEADLHAEEVGGDFAGEAARLGTALAEVHEQLRASFGTGTQATSELAAAMHARLDDALEVVPQLGEHADRLRGAFDALTTVPEVPTQRIHADLHLGQTLRTIKGWKIVDFEGEPAKPLAERLHPDSPWRDVAGMLRSFDYAPHAVAQSIGDDDHDAAAQRERRANEWAARNKDAFLQSYAGDQGLTPTEGALVAAYVADKAVYECVYEARNRPNWLPIPLAAIATIGTP